MIGAMSLAMSFVVTLLAFSLLWVRFRMSDRLAVIDLYWGPGFLVIGLIHAAFLGVSPLRMVFLSCVAIWAIRLTWHLGARLASHTHDDSRYEKMKQQGGAAFRTSSLWKVFWLQAVIQWSLALPVHAAFLARGEGGPSPVMLWIGLCVFVAGFATEVIADARLARFKAGNPPTDALLRTGLWAWSRHPNHFGESVLWFGLATMAVAMTGAWWCYAGPAVLTLVMVRLSGVAMLDAHLSATRPEFDAYAATTSAFVPWPPKRT